MSGGRGLPARRTVLVPGRVRTLLAPGTLGTLLMLGPLG